MLFSNVGLGGRWMPGSTCSRFDVSVAGNTTRKGKSTRCGGEIGLASRPPGDYYPDATFHRGHPTANGPARRLLIFNLIHILMPTLRNWNCRIAILATIGLSCWANVVEAQELPPPPGVSADYVNYQIMPLPPVDEIYSADDGDSPAGSLLKLPATDPLESEEVKPLEADGDASPAEGDKSSEGEEGAEAKDELEIPLEEQSLWYFWRAWDLSYELGVNGSVGNSDTHTWRTAAKGKRATETSVLTASVDYRKSMDQSKTTADRLFQEWRAEFPNKNNQWSWYMHGTVEFDAFRAYDARVTEDNGIGYQWYKNDVGSFITRAGAGTSREFGGPKDEWIPEGVLGAVYERKINKRQKFSLSNEFFFDLTEFGENRMNTKGDWQVILDEAHLSLKVALSIATTAPPTARNPTTWTIPRAAVDFLTPALRAKSPRSAAGQASGGATNSCLFGTYAISSETEFSL